MITTTTHIDRTEVELRKRRQEAARKPSRVVDRKARKRDECNFDLAEEFGQIGTLGLFSERYLECIKYAVTSAFVHRNDVPTKNFCDADVDDVSQDLTITLMGFFRKHGKSVRDYPDGVAKSRYLVSIAFKYAKYQVVNHICKRSFGRQISKDYKGYETLPRISSVSNESLSLIRVEDKSEEPDRETEWERFTDVAYRKLPEKTACAAVALASSDSYVEASEISGLSSAAFDRHRRNLKQVLGCRESDCCVFSHLKDHVCVQCGDRIIGKNAVAITCSTTCARKLNALRSREARALAR